MIDPLGDIKSCLNWMQANGRRVSRVYIPRNTWNRIKKETGLKTKEDVISEYRKRFPTEEIFKVKII